MMRVETGAAMCAPLLCAATVAAAPVAASRAGAAMQDKGAIAHGRKV